MNETLMVAAAAHFDLGKLGRRATTQVFLTYLIHLFYLTPTPRHLPACGLISLPFAPALVLTRLLAVLLSLLSLQTLHAVVTAAARCWLALPRIPRPRTSTRCQWRCAADFFRACGGRRAIVEAGSGGAWTFPMLYFCVLFIGGRTMPRVKCGQNFFIA